MEPEDKPKHNSNGGAESNPAASTRFKSSGRAPALRTAAEIQEWFIATLARITQVPHDNIDITVSFEHFALDSVTAIGLTGELEEWLDYTVDPMAVYDYPTIEALSNHLSERIASTRE